MERESTGTERAAATGGLVRSLAGYTRIVARTLKSARLGKLLKLPKKVPTNLVSTSAEHLRSVMEMRENFMEVKEGGHEHGSASHSQVHQQTVVESNQTRFQRFSSQVKTSGRNVFLAIPGFIKTISLTTFIFTFYEESMEKAHHHLHHEHGIHNSDSSLNHHGQQATLLLAPFALGATGGALHGGLNVVLDNGQRWLFPSISELQHSSTVANVHPHSQAVLSTTQKILGYTFSHSLVFSSLFGSYETTKRLSFSALDMDCDSAGDLSSAVGASCVVLSGTVAGLVSESIAHYTEHFEARGVSATSWSAMKSSVRPSLSSCLPGTMSTVLGFLALEYAKKFFSSS